MNAPTRLRMSAEEYLVWEASQESKHELVDGVVRQMAGATIQHILISGNVFLALATRLRGSSCRAYNADAKVRTGERSYRYPDVTVDCGKPNPMDMFADQPTVLVEVSSASTEVIDALTKLEEYKALSTAKHIILLSQRRALGRVLTRTDSGWITADAEGLEEALTLSHFGFHVPLAEIYDGVDFIAEPEA
jgi:Uma2 family endonuclease